MVTHQLQVERRTGKVRLSKTDVLPTVLLTFANIYLLVLVQKPHCSSQFFYQ